jgi:hypothetical protein
MRALASFIAVWALMACSSPDAANPDSHESQPDGGTGTDHDPGSSDAPDGGGDKPGPGITDGPWAPPNESGDVTFPYKAYRCGYAIRAVSPARPKATFHADAAGAAPAVRNLHLTFAGEASSSVVIQWSTDAATMGTEVRFGESPTKLDLTAHGFSFTYGVANRRQHELHLCGLKPGTTYYYDAGGAKARSTAASFVTAPDRAESVKVLVVGDTRTNPSVLSTIAQKALAEGPDVMVQSGDAVASGGNQGQWDALFAAAPQLFAQVPGIWAHGNHEGLNEVYFAQVALPDNGGARGNEEWFSTTYGPLRFVVLNDTVAQNGDIGLQTTFLGKELGAVDRARTPFAIGMHHQPMYTTSSNHDSNTAIRGAWAKVFDQFHLNVDIAGHVHSYESTPALKGGTAASVGTVATDATGTHYFNFGGGGADLYDFKGAQPVWISKRESVNGYAIMTVDATKIHWVAHRSDGTTVETIDIGK